MEKTKINLKLNTGRYRGVPGYSVEATDGIPWDYLGYVNLVVHRPMIIGSLELGVGWMVSCRETGMSIAYHPKNRQLAIDDAIERIDCMGLNAFRARKHEIIYSRIT